MSAKITCVSHHGATLDVVDLGLTFAAGETQSVTDEQAAMLLVSPQFVDESGKNPNFTCMICAKTSYDEFTRVGNDMVHLVSDDGKRTCLDCFENRLEQPKPNEAVKPEPPAVEPPAPEPPAAEPPAAEPPAAEPPAVNELPIDHEEGT